MTPVLVTMAIVLAIAVLALLCTAWPHRRGSLPQTRWLDDLMERAQVAVPVIRDGDLDPPDPVTTPEREGPSRR